MRINENFLFLNPELRTREEIIELGCELMDYHGLEGWTFKIDVTRSTRRAGQCRYRVKEIGVTREYALKASPADLKQTIIHEIAHAFTRGAHHGTEWKNKMKELGADPKRCHDTTWTEPRAWILCSKCDKEHAVGIHKELDKYTIEDGKITSHLCGRCGRGRSKSLFVKYDHTPKKGWIEIEHWSDQVEPEPAPAPEPVEDPETIRCPRVSVFPSTIVQPSFLDDVPIMTFEREPGKATFIHDKSKQLSLFE